MDPIRHAESRNPIESMARHVPGFRGYLEKEYRRDSDHLARSWIADQLQNCKSSLDELQRSMLDAGQLDLLPACERMRSRVDGLQSRIRGAMRGYSGFFDFVRVDEGVLDQVYQLDMGLLDDAAALAQSLDVGTETSPQDKLSRLSQQIERLSRDFDKRRELLEGMN